MLEVIGVGIVVAVMAYAIYTDVRARWKHRGRVVVTLETDEPREDFPPPERAKIDGVWYIPGDSREPGIELSGEWYVRDPDQREPLDGGEG